MALVRRCPVCARIHPVSTDYCDGSPPGAHPRRLLLPPEEEEPQAPPQAQGCLVFHWGEEKIEGVLGIGRDDAFSPLGKRIEDENLLEVGRRHAEMSAENGAFFVRDLNSKNGTFLNGRRLGKEKERLADGDKIEFSHQLPANLRIQP